MTFHIGKPQKGRTGQENAEYIYQYLNKLADSLNYALNHIDAQNLTEMFAASLQGSSDMLHTSITKSKMSTLSNQTLLSHTQNCVLFRGTAGSGDTIALNDFITNYRFVVVRFTDSLFEAVCPVTEDNKNGAANAVRGSSSYVSANSVSIRSVTATYSDDTSDQLTLADTYMANLSGSSFKITATKITRIMGVK